MAGTRRQTNIKDVGNVTDYSLKAQRDLGVSDVHDVSQKINLDELSIYLDELTNQQPKCIVGDFLETLEPELQNKLKSILGNTNVSLPAISSALMKVGVNISSDSIRRHRNRMAGKSGCRCSSES